MNAKEHESPAPVLFRLSGSHAPRLIAIAVAAILIFSGGSAAALWSLSGSGSGAAATGISSPLTLSAGSTTAGLFPGGSAAVSFVASNPNSTTATVSSFALDTARGTGGFAVDAGHASCNLASLSFQPPANPSGWTVPARSGGGDGILAVSLAGALSMSSAAASACQGATFTVYLKASS